MGVHEMLGSSRVEYVIVRRELATGALFEQGDSRSFGLRLVD